MPRKIKPQQPIRKEFLSELAAVISTPNEEILYDSEWWKEKPVSIEIFCEDFIREKLFPKQLDFTNAMVGASAFDFSDDYDEGHAFWGKGSGKDRTIAKMVAYVCYKLCCLKNPQRFLREKYGLSIGEGDSIDIANMSVNARQANNVFFKKFKTLLKRCLNPNTGNNWFVEQGVDLRESYDLLKFEVNFHNGVTAHSLNSETNTGEGLNLFIATVDEFGMFPVDDAFELIESLRTTIQSRFKKFGSLAVISFHYYRNDPMQMLYELEKDNPRVYSSKASTYDVNLLVSKKDLGEFYSRNLEKSKMTFECESSASEGGYVTKKYMISKMFTPKFENPIKGELISVDTSFLPNLQFKSWFKGSAGLLYTIHVDMATGKIQDKSGNVNKNALDCAGITLLHADKMFPKIDDKLMKDLAKEGIIIEKMGEEIQRKGMIIDLSIQLMAKQGSEIQFSDVRKFILRLKEFYGFNIILATYDGWQSKDSIQILNENGIEAEQLSVDKTNDAYDTWKELMYQQLIKAYPNNIAEREAKELIVTDKGKIDHPEKSWERYKTEKIQKGSKDVMDSIVGAVLTAYNKIPVDSDVFFA